MARPPKIADDDLFDVIDELRVQNRVLTGVVVRAELQRRLGFRCGSQRVYRLLRQVRPRPPPLCAADSALTELPDATSLIAQLTAERDTAIARAELAEFRERATQDRTANQIYDMRHKLQSLGFDPHDLSKPASKFHV